MNITEIKAQVKTVGRYSIFVDGKYSFSLSEAALLERGLRIGQELDKQTVQELKQASADDKLYGNVLRFVAMRPRSEWEVRQYLVRKQASPALAEITLNKLSKNGMINDLLFAKGWIESRRLLRSPSRRKILQELRAKHVNEAIILQALEVEHIDEPAILRELIAKKRRQPRYRDNLKLMQYLARQGFSYEDIKNEVAQTEPPTL